MFSSNGKNASLIKEPAGAMMSSYSETDDLNERISLEKLNEELDTNST
jgi:hypothetical protein